MPEPNDTDTNTNEINKANNPDNAKLSNITDSQAWKSSASGISRFWNNYKILLANSFSTLSRKEQESVISRFSMIITIGATIVIITTFYPYLPLPIRLLSLPAAIAAGFIGYRIIGPIVIERIKSFLNPGN